MIFALFLSVLSILNANNPPGIAFTTSAGFVQVTEYTQTNTDYVYDSDKAKAIVRKINNNEWELQLFSKNSEISKVWFPWEANQVTLDDDNSDDIAYSAFLMGQTRKMQDTCNFCWEGVEYPGLSFSPLVIVADDDNARLVAATNWPPRRVHPLFSLNRIGLNYQSEVLPPNSSQTYRAMYIALNGDTSKGRPPWYLVSQIYRDWLVGKMTDSGLWPLNFDEKMLKSHGFLNVGLMNMAEYNPEQVLAYWNQHKSKVNWIQFWGQMSNYVGPTNLAKPALAQGEPTGCCLEKLTMHSRYAQTLPNIAATIKNDGGLVGYYSRPRSINDNFLELSNDSNLNFLQSWIKQNTDYGANVYYLDVVGSIYMGPSANVANLLKEYIPKNAFIEYPVETYPVPFSASGCLTGADPQAGPTREFSNLGRGTFPRLGRAILDHHMMFLGGSNGDHTLVGPTGEYWSERQAFLLGAKLDIISMTESGDYVTGIVNKAVERIIRLRDQSDWWNLNPQYLDVLNISNVPRGIDIRRFRAKNGINLYVIDNPVGQTDKWFLASGRKIDIPNEVMSIIKVSRDNDVIGGIISSIK